MTIIIIIIIRHLYSALSSMSSRALYIKRACMIKIEKAYKRYNITYSNNTSHINQNTSHIIIMTG